MEIFMVNGLVGLSMRELIFGGKKIIKMEYSMGSGHVGLKTVIVGKNVFIRMVKGMESILSGGKMR